MARAGGTVQCRPKFLLLYGLEAFDGRYESWLKCVFREDRPSFVTNGTSVCRGSITRARNTALQGVQRAAALTSRLSPSLASRRLVAAGHRRQ